MATHKKDGSSYDNNIRRWFHVITISILTSMYGISGLSAQTLLFPLALVSMIVIGFDILRLHIPTLNRILQHYFGSILRKHELHSLSGTSWLLISAMICVILFQKIAVVMGFLYLAFGDPTASYVGIRWGNKDIGNKTWIGSLGFFLICAAIGFPCIIFLTTWKKCLLIVSLPALVGAIVERNLKEMDDNLAIPIVVAGLISLLLNILV